MKKIIFCLILVSLLLVGSVLSISSAAVSGVNCVGAVGEMTYQCLDDSNKFCAYHVEDGTMSICLGTLRQEHKPDPVINE